MKKSWFLLTTLVLLILSVRSVRAVDCQAGIYGVGDSSQVTTTWNDPIRGLVTGINGIRLWNRNSRLEIPADQVKLCFENSLQGTSQVESVFYDFYAPFTPEVAYGKTYMCSTFDDNFSGDTIYYFHSLNTTDPVVKARVFIKGLGESSFTDCTYDNTDIVIAAPYLAY